MKDFKKMPKMADGGSVREADAQKLRDKYSGFGSRLRDTFLPSEEKNNQKKKDYEEFEKKHPPKGVDKFGLPIYKRGGKVKK